MRSSWFNDHPPTCTCSHCNEYRSKRKSCPTRDPRPGHEWVACSMCDRTGEIISLAEGKPMRCPTCFRHGWVQRRIDAPSDQSQAANEESLTAAEQPREKSADSLTNEEEERLTQDERANEKRHRRLSEKDKEWLDSTLAEASRLLSRPKKPSKQQSRGDIHLGPHNPYYGQPLEKQSSESHPPSAQGSTRGPRRVPRQASPSPAWRPPHQKSGRSPLWPIVGIIMVVVLIFVAYVVVDRRDRTVATDSLREPDDVARIVKDEAPRPDPQSSTGTPANPAPKPTEPVPQAVATSEADELRIYALDLINKAREAHGLPSVVLGSNPAAQMHAEDMLANDYMGHWWADGRKPYMVYSETGVPAILMRMLLARVGLAASGLPRTATTGHACCHMSGSKSGTSNGA